MRKWIVQFKPAEETETHIVVSWLLWSRARERDTPISHRFFFSAASVSRSSRGTNRPEFKWAEASTLLRFTTDPCVRMNSNSKSPSSTAIKAEIKRHESLQSAINRLSKQFERVADQQLRSGLKVYLHSIQGKLRLSSSSLWWTFVRCIWRRKQNITCWLHYHQDVVHRLTSRTI